MPRRKRIKLSTSQHDCCVSFCVDKDKEPTTDNTTGDKLLPNTPGQENAERAVERPEKTTAWSSIRQNCQKHIVIIIMNVVFVIVIAVLAAGFVPRYTTSTQSNQTCMKCETLTTIVEKWAWKDVSEDKHSDMCCFNSETGLVTMLKHFLIHRKRSILHLTSLETVNAEGASLTISWTSILQQGRVFLSNDTCSVSIMKTGIYVISTQVKFRTTVKNDRTMKEVIKLYIAVWRQGILTRIDHYGKQYVFRLGKTEHNVNLHSMPRLEKGDDLIIRFPSSQKSYLASERGAHEMIADEINSYSSQHFVFNAFFFPGEMYLLADSECRIRARL